MPSRLQVWKTALTEDNIHLKRTTRVNSKSTLIAMIHLPKLFVFPLIQSYEIFMQGCSDGFRRANYCEIWIMTARGLMTKMWIISWFLMYFLSGLWSPYWQTVNVYTRWLVLDFFFPHAAQERSSFVPPLLPRNLFSHSNLIWPPSSINSNACRQVFDLQQSNKIYAPGV